MHFSKDPCSCYCVGGKMKINLHLGRGGRVPATSQRPYSREESDSRIKFPLKSACEISHICKAALFMSHLLMAARITGRTETHRSDWSHRTTDRLEGSSALSSLPSPVLPPACLQFCLSVGPPHLRPLCLISPSDPLSLKDETKCYEFHACIDFFFFFFTFYTSFHFSIKYSSRHWRKKP